MTYFGILALFILPPLLVLGVIVPRDLWKWVFQRGPRPDGKPYAVLLGHVALALAYTTPWDNYLVATGVWWYNPSLVTGLTLGWVPIEEYTFFMLQTLLTGLWTLGLMWRFFPLPASLPSRPRLRHASALLIGLAWVISLGLWLSGWKPATYLSLILAWALIPVFIQLIFGADILWASRRLLMRAILPPTLYLWLLDFVALSDTTWIISPEQTTGIRLGVLPIEEMLFFLMTNVIIGLGITLMLSPVSQERAAALIRNRQQAKEPL